MKLNPAPRFLHVVGVQIGEVTVGKIATVQTFAPTARVLANNSERLKDIPVGGIVFFAMQNLNQISVEEDGPHGILFEDAVLGWTREEDLPGKLQAPMVRIVDPTKPGIVSVDGQGAEIRYKNRN